jgi:DoxX-like family
LTAAYVTITVITAALNVWAAVSDWMRATFVVANATDVGVPHSWLPVLGALKAAGAAGLVIGLAGVRPVGIAAATGLTLFFVGAIVAHLRARAYAKIVFPGCFLGLATASLILATTR